jgi:hypothetical protein
LLISSSTLKGYTASLSIYTLFDCTPAMYATCAALKSVKPARARIASLDISLLTDPLLDGCYAWLTEAFTQLGGDDKASKGPSLIAALKLKIIEEYGKKTST